MKKILAILCINILCAQSSFSATAVDLRHYSANDLHKLVTSRHGLAADKTDIDFNQTTHIHLQQTYNGLPVWNAESVIHIPKARKITAQHWRESINASTTMNGIVYNDIASDLANKPESFLNAVQKSRALQAAKRAYCEQISSPDFHTEQEEISAVIFVDHNNVVHYAFYINFYASNANTMPHRPAMIVDAANQHVYQSWDLIAHLETVMAGGVGGNEKSGKKIYDGSVGNFPALTLERDNDNCLLRNNDIEIHDAQHRMTFGTRINKIATGLCKQSPMHDNLWWLSLDSENTSWTKDEYNGGYSPSLDLLYAATIVRNLFVDWYKMPVLTENNNTTPVKISIIAHFGDDFMDANWDRKTRQLYFGDGGTLMHPLTSLDVVAHELGHMVQAQYCSAINSGLYESFADMTAAAALYYRRGTNDWKIGSEVMKNDALRYMDDPKKDGLSIDHMKDLTSAMDGHYTNGIFNKAFYLIATSPGWNTQRAYNVMLKAMMHYWMPSAKGIYSFTEAACGVLSATRDYHKIDSGYLESDVVAAFRKVGIDTSNC